MNIELHLHTDAYYNGIGDGAQTVVQAIDAAAKCSATAVAITDHGNCANWTDFFAYARGEEVDHQTLEKKGLKPVKPILGVEAYIKKEEQLIREDVLSDELKELLEKYRDKAEITKISNQHLILLAKNYKGFQEISRFVSETNRLIKAKERPVGSYELLTKLFDNENVVCSSACIAGVIANPLLFNNRIDREIAKIERRIASSEESLGQEYFDAKEKVESVNAEIFSREEEVNSLSEVAKKKYGRIKNSIKKEKDEAKKAVLLEALDVEMVETEKAKEKIKNLKLEIKEFKASISEEKKILTKAKNKLSTIEQNNSLIKLLEASKKTEDEMFKDAVATANQYKNIFGDNFYIELQYHHISVEAYVMPLLVKVAKECNIKCIITNDVHVDTKENLKIREYVRNCASIKRPWVEPIPGDEELYYKTDDEKREILSEIISADVIEEAFKNVEKVANECNLEKLSESNHYPQFVDADNKLRELALTGSTEAELLDGRKISISSKTAGIKSKYGDNWNNDLQKRFDYEMGVISQMGFSSYFLFIADVIIKCKEARENATDIGPGRGSGAGSIVCFLSDITELDPIKYDLLFERFLNPERVSMPDIDTDFSRFARQYAIDYVTEFYGAKAVSGIMTKGKMQARNALTYAPKLLAKEEGLDIKAYSEKGAALRKLLGNEINIKLSEIEDEVKESFKDDKTSLKIFEIAKGLEGKITSFGQHAAGIISIMDGDIQDFIPCMMAEDTEGNDKMVIQGDMVVAEAELGFIKFDFLGLKNLNVITACQQMITKNHGIVLDTYHLPLDDKEVYSEIFANKNTNFVFQFESDGMKKMLADLKPTKFEDLVLAVSVYRPGPMDFIPDIIRCKNEGITSPIVERIPVLKETLAETYGFPVYQEQVMKIMTLCAGFTTGHADNVRRFMSKKKQDKLAAEEPVFIKGCVKNGIKAEDAKWLFDQLMPFAKYGFNKSHAAAYSLVSYITAYLKHHYPTEYLCAAMLEQGDKTLQFLSDCKRYGLDVYPVSVNKSEVNFMPDASGIRIGFSAIKGLKMDGQKIADNRSDVGYVSLVDFINKNQDIKINSVESCILAGALDDFVKNRETAVEYAKGYNELISKKNEAEEKINLAKEGDNEKKAVEWTSKLNIINTEIKALNPRQTFELSDEKKRNYEAIYLGMYLSGSPLDDYDTLNPKYRGIDELRAGDKFTTIGVVNDFKEIKTSKGDRMCFFKLLDKDSHLTEVVVFPKQYKELDNVLNDGLVVEIKGEYDYKKDSDDEFQIIADGIKVMIKSDKELFINTTSLTNLSELLDLLKNYSAPSGMKVSIKSVTGIRDLEYKISDDAIKKLTENAFEYVIS